MARVVLTGILTQYSGGQAEVDLDVTNISGMYRRLGEMFPDLAPHLGEGLAVSIDGQIYQDALLQPIPEDAEVHLIPRISGGA